MIIKEDATMKMERKLRTLLTGRHTYVNRIDTERYL